MEKFLLINVLAPDVYADCHIKGSINVPYDMLSDYVQKLPKDTDIILYCASYVCPMSKRAWHLLKSLGCTNVKAYEGGAAEWYVLGYPTEGPALLSYLHEEYDKPTETGEIATISAKDLLKRLSS